MSADALASVPLFAALDLSARSRLAEQLREHDFERGTRILRQGERGARVLGFLVVAEGEAAVIRDGEDVARLGPCDFFGEIGLFRDKPRNANVKAETDLRCYAMSSWEFRPSSRLIPISAGRSWPSWPSVWPNFLRVTADRADA